MITKRNIKLLHATSIIIIFMHVFIGLANAGESNRCSSFELRIDNRGNVDRLRPVIVIREGAPIYKDAGTSSPMKKHISFNTKLNILRKSNTRFQIKKIGSDSPLGWMEGSELVCTIEAMKSAKTGLEKIFFIKVDVEMQKEKKTVTVYPWPDSKDCPSGGCRALTRFQKFFIFDYDKDSKRYLLADIPEVTDADTVQLWGWADENDGFIWDTAYGLRPREDLLFPAGHSKAGEPMTTFAYKSLADAKNKRNPLSILGGPIWYRYENRIFLIEREENFYKVIISALGGGSEYFSPETVGITGNISGIKNLNKIDIFFLVDGTETMQPYIEAVRGNALNKGVVQQIIDKFSKDERFKKTQFRFGFRIYRDTYAEDKELGEGLPLDDRCEAFGKLDDFNRLITKVNASRNDNDDYEENLFGGIKQAINDMHTCPSHTKILFIIGDHGYNPLAQQARDIAPVSLDYLIKHMKGSRKEGSQSIVTFFIQTPKNRNKSTNAKYNSAYDVFTEQSKKILEGLLNNREVNKYMLDIDDYALSEKIINAVKRFSISSEAQTELILDLRGGISLQKALERIKDKYSMPILFVENAINGNCIMLGEQCNSNIYNLTMEGYIPISEDIVEDISIKSADLNAWIRALRSIESLSHKEGREQRREVVNTLKKELGIALGRDLVGCGLIFECLKGIAGLPVNDNSPLFKYSLEQLMDPNQVRKCEFTRILKWMRDTKDMLITVSKGDKKPQYKTIPYPGDCPTGNNIPYIPAPIVEEWLCPGCSYKYSIQKTTYYWVPKEFMP